MKTKTAIQIAINCINQVLLPFELRHRIYLAQPEQWASYEVDSEYYERLATAIEKLEVVKKAFDEGTWSWQRFSDVAADLDWELDKD